jgi:hypothetical protein
LENSRRPSSFLLSSNSSKTGNESFNL